MSQLEPALAIIERPYAGVVQSLFRCLSTPQLPAELHLATVQKLSVTAYAPFSSTIVFTTDGPHGQVNEFEARLRWTDGYEGDMPTEEGPLCRCTIASTQDPAIIVAFEIRIELVDDSREAVCRAVVNAN